MMLQKWKNIITNWISCSSDEIDLEKCNVNIEALHTIISHLRDNLNLDESKSSLFEAHTVEQFILEKYPSFKFENGTAIADGEDEVYLIASLILFFVCVNSKDIHLKNAMCSKLSGGDQEIILKFSKILMECSSITCKDVQSAIKEACGQDVAFLAAGHCTVPETPPALRSLHSEVRRLQAALDAERFDRNYLQEELSRTNLRVEKLVQDKEKYKQDIINLTARISQCGGGEHETQSESGAADFEKVSRQLADMEERLVRTQEELNEAAYDRDDLKRKMEALKQDRDKWVATSQEESIRAGQLVEELETERRHLQSLKELITELRQHNRLNGLDSSQLECDDPDASIQSLTHNMSVCSEACVNVVEVQLCEERAKVVALNQQIQTLQKENEQLHFAIEEDNSTREIIIKEKDSIIDKLENQLKNQALLLESLRKDHEDVTLCWEKYKLESRILIDEKDDQIRQLNGVVASLRQQYAELETARDELSKKADDRVKAMMDIERKYKAENVKLSKSISQEEAKYLAIAKDRDVLQRQLNEERIIKGKLEAEQNHLHESYKRIILQNKEIINDKAVLAQQLADEKSLRETLEEQKKALSTQISTTEQTYVKQIKNIKKKMAKEVSKNKSLLQERDIHKQELQDATAASQQIENEKNKLLVDINMLEGNIVELNKQVSQLTEKTDNLGQQYESERAKNEALTEEKKVLIQNLIEEKTKLLEANESLQAENESLKHALNTQQGSVEDLLKENQVLLQEKDELVRVLEMEKSARDELETEKNGLSLKINELKEEYTAEIDVKQTKLEEIAEKLNQLRHKCEDLEELNKEISATVSSGLDKLIDDLRNEVTRNEILKQLIEVGHEDMSIIDKCNLYTTIADALVTEVRVRESLEKTIEIKENTEANLKEELTDKEAQINELITETKKLQEEVEDARIGLSKQNEQHTRELQDKIKETQEMVKENEALKNDLNSIRIQLDVKVYSLKEKLVENENLTDKLKKSYECQLDNLNLMITKLTNFLKDKSNELEAMKKEKDKLQLALDDNCTVIKSLEEEVKVEKQNQEKLISEFENERQILKNMVAVTESVMEDQKVTFNNTISEYVKTNEMLQEENRNIKEQNQNERTNFEEKIFDKEKVLKSMQTNLAELKSLKEERDQEFVSEKEELNEKINSLKTKVQEKEDDVRKLQEENSNLEFTMQNYKDNLATCEKENSELKIKMDALEVESAVKFDKLNKSLEEQMEHKQLINNELVERKEYIIQIENKLKELEADINRLQQEKDNLISEKDSLCLNYEAKINEMLTQLQTSSLKGAEDIDKLSNFNAYLTDENSKLKSDCTVLEERLDTLKEDNVNLEKQINKLKQDNLDLEREANNINVINKQLEEQKDKLEKTIMELELELSHMKKRNTESERELDAVKLHNERLAEEICRLNSCIKDMEAELERSVKVSVELEEKLSTLKAENLGSLEEIDKLKKDVTQTEQEVSILKEYNKDITEVLGTLKNNNIEVELELNKVKNDNTNLESKLRKLKEDKKTLEEELEGLTQKNMDANHEIDTMKNYICLIEGLMANLKNDNIIINEKVDTLKNDNNALEQELEALKTHNTQLKVELDNSKTNNAAVLEEVDKLKILNIELERKIVQNQNYNSELDVELNKLKEDNIVLSKELGKVKKGNNELQEELGQLRINNNNLEKELNELKKNDAEELGKYIENNKELDLELATLKERYTKLEEDFSQSKTNIIELNEEFNKLNTEKLGIENEVENLKKCKVELEMELNKLKLDNTKSKEEMILLQKCNNDLTEEKITLKNDILKECDKWKKQNKGLEEEMDQLRGINAQLETEIEDLKKNNKFAENKMREREIGLEAELGEMKLSNKKISEELNELKKEKAELSLANTELEKENMDLNYEIINKKKDITDLEVAIKKEQEQHKKILDDLAAAEVTLASKCDILQTYHTKAEIELEDRQKEITSLQKEVHSLQLEVDLCKQDSKAKDAIISKMSKEKDVIINSLNMALREEKELKEKYLKELEEKATENCELKMKLMFVNNEREALNILKNENAELIKAVGYRETMGVRSQDITSSQKYSGQLAEREVRDLHHQVDNTSDLTHSSTESLKTITDLEKIIHDKNRTITTLQSEITYLKTLVAESENKLLDVAKELEVSKENCDQLSGQLKKIVYQKNEEIGELKKQVSKMSVTETGATQIIKISAKYKAIILKRIAEIKSNTVLKELTNFGTSNNQTDSELRRNLAAGSITMEDLENFLETTERHLKKCTDKQIFLQKEKDRLVEVNKINESEIINLKKFLTELSVSFQTFSSVKDLYAQKLSRIISVQRTVRREILSLDGQASDACILALERGYAAVMQDLAECAMNLERWVERCIGRSVSAEKIKQAFMNDPERASLAPASVQNAGLEVQLDELENSFQKLLEEVARAARGPPGPTGSTGPPAPTGTVMEVRAEYEDKLNRMKAKMKQLYTEQIAVFKEKQREEVSRLEHELSRARDKLALSSRAYEQHIRSLTSELWDVGEKFLMKKDEAELLRRKQRSGSLMSLQHIHSSGLIPSSEQSGRPSEAFSLRSLPIKNNTGARKREGRGLYMSDEEGEVFDNRCLKELATPGRDSATMDSGIRLSELRWRNSLCPPHLKSSYPAETQFAKTLEEEEIKAISTSGAVGVRQQRKEVGITAYKKPGPPTPSKQAGRLSATDSELRESLRVEVEPQPTRKTSTPSRIRSLFRSSKTENIENTPRSRRLSNIFRKK